MYQQGYRPPPQMPPQRRMVARAEQMQGARVKKEVAKRKPTKTSPQGSSYYGPNGSMVRHGRKKTGGRRVFFLIFLIAALAFGAYYGKTWLEVSPYDGFFAPNVYVDGMSLEGLTAQQGIDAIYQNAQTKAQSFTIRLMYGEQLVASIGSDMLGISFDPKAALNEAWNIGHQGTVFDRKQALDAVKATPYNAYSTKPDANTQPIDELLIKIKNEVYQAPSNAALLEFNPAADEPFAFQQEVQGRSLDVDTLKAKIYQKVANMESGDIQIELSYAPPEITVADLEQTVTLRFRATTQVAKDSTENRTNNIRRAFEKISGTVLKPGEKFSFNKIVGWRSQENGFYEAVEYAYGETVLGIGGGVCRPVPPYIRQPFRPVWRFLTGNPILPP